MSILQSFQATDLQRFGVVLGTCGLTNLSKPGLMNRFAGAAMTAASAGLLQNNWKLAGYPLSIATAAAGWRDLSRMQFKSGITKLLAGTVGGAAAHAYTSGNDIGSITLAETAFASSCIASAGLGIVVLDALSPVIEGAFKCAARVCSCCDRIVEANRRAALGDDYGQPVTNTLRYA